MISGEEKEGTGRIAAETGLCDAPHLIHTFREAEGTAPEAWRAAQRVPA